MYNAFVLEVTDALGRKVWGHGQVGGAPMTPEEIADHIERGDHFPGAKEIRIHPSDSAAAANLHEAIAQAKGETTKLGRVISTPRARMGKIIRSATPPPPIPPMPGTYANPRSSDRVAAAAQAVAHAMATGQKPADYLVEMAKQAGGTPVQPTTSVG